MINSMNPLEITSRGAQEEFWCKTKHLLHAEGHTEENIANAVRDNPELVPILADQLNRIRQLRQESVDLLLGRRSTEGKGCVRCSADLAIFKERKLVENQLSLNTSDEYINTEKKTYSYEKRNYGINMNTEIKSIAVIGVGQLAGRVVKDYADKSVGTTFGVSTSTLLGVGGGLALTAGAIYGRDTVGDDVATVMAVAGTALLVNKLYDMVKGYTAGGASVRMVMPSSSYAAPIMSSRGTGYIY